MKVESVKSLGRKSSGAQSQGQPHTPAPQTPERRGIADALRAPVEKKLKKSVEIGRASCRERVLKTV